MEGIDSEGPHGSTPLTLFEIKQPKRVPLLLQTGPLDSGNEKSFANALHESAQHILDIVEVGDHFPCIKKAKPSIHRFPRPPRQTDRVSLGRNAKRRISEAIGDTGERVPIVKPLGLGGRLFVKEAPPIVNNPFRQRIERDMQLIPNGFGG